MDEQIVDNFRRPTTTVRDAVPVAAIVELFAANASLHFIYVESRSGEYLGALARRDILDWISRNHLSNWDDADAAERAKLLLNRSEVNSVLEAADQPPAISRDTTVAVAFRIMTRSGCPVIPVIDDYPRVIGEVRLSELLRSAL